jgi:tetratricopeptide (TPR) repeat protein
MYARRCGDLWYESWPLQRIPIALVLSGRFAEAQTVATEAYELAVKTNNWGHHSLVSGALACVAVARGDFDRAERHTQDTMALLARSRYPYGGALALPAVACARALRGAWQSAEKALDTLLEPGAVFEQPGSVFTAMTQVYRQLVRLWAGAAGVPQAPPTPTVQALVGKEGVDVTALAPLCALIEIADHLGTPALVKQPYQALSLAVAQGVLFTRGWMFLIPRVLGVAAALCQQWETAEDYFRQALEVAGRVQARPELGRTYLDYARMLSRREEYANLARAVECAQQAAVLFGELGMSPFSQRAAQLTLALQQHMASSLPRPTQEFRSTSATSIYLRLAQSDMHFLV